MISNYCQKLSEFETLAVVCFMGSQTEKQLTESWLEELNIKPHSLKSTSVKFVKPYEIEGSEFAVVLVLLNFKHVSEIAGRLTLLFFTSITRATTKLAIVINQDQMSESQSNYESDSFTEDSELQNEFSEIRKGPSLRPQYLFIGPKKPTTSEFLSGDHQLTAGSSVLDLSLYIGKEGGSFLYCQDVCKESHISMLNKMGIRKIVIFDYFMAHPFYELTAQMISLFSEKMDINVRTILGIDKIHDLSQIITFCLAYYKEDNPKKWISQVAQWTNFDQLLTADTMSFNWLLVKKKGLEAEREQMTLIAFAAYSLWLRILSDETHPINKQFSRLEIRYERAEVHAKLSLISMRATEELHKPDFRLFKTTTVPLPVYTPHEFPYLVISAIKYALKSAELNPCSEESYEAFTPAMEELGKYFQEEKKKYEKMTTETSRELAIAELVRKDKKNKNLTEFFTESSHYPNDSRYDGEINKYKEQFISAAGKSLVASRKTLSSLAMKLSKETFHQAGHLTDGANNREVVLETVSKLQFTFNCPFRFAIEAWQWNPTDPEVYQVIFDAMKLVEKQVDIVHRSVHLLDGYVEETVLAELQLMLVEGYNSVSTQ